MMWHVVFAERDGRVQSRAARSRDSAIHVACELLTKPLMFEGFWSRTAGLSSGLNLTSISTEGAFRGCGGVPRLR